MKKKKAGKEISPNEASHVDKIRSIDDVSKGKREIDVDRPATESIIDSWPMEEVLKSEAALETADIDSVSKYKENRES